jgi:hypothetical protein
LKNKFACKSERLKGYRNAIWNLIEDLDAIDLIAIPREQNAKADELAVAASTLQLPDSLIDEHIAVEVIFRPSVRITWIIGRCLMMTNRWLSFYFTFMSFQT